MNNNSKFIIKQALRLCFCKYIVAIIIAILLFIMSQKSSEVAFQSLFLNVSGGLFALPIIFLSHDVFQAIRTRKQREIVEMQLNQKIETIFIRFIFMANKIRHNFESAIQAAPEFLEGRNSGTSQIFDEISSTKHNGFFLFSYLDNFIDETTDILNSPLFLTYASNNIISLISDFEWHYQQLLNEFKLITKEDFIFIETDMNIDFELSKETKSTYKTYNIFKNVDGKHHVLYIANYPIFDEDMLKGRYRISGTKAKKISDYLHKIYSIIKKWEDISQRELSVESVFVSAGRLCDDTTINLYAQNNISINIQWP